MALMNYAKIWGEPHQDDRGITDTHFAELVEDTASNIEVAWGFNPHTEKDGHMIITGPLYESAGFANALSTIAELAVTYRFKRLSKVLYKLTSDKPDHIVSVSEVSAITENPAQSMFDLCGDMVTKLDDVLQANPDLTLLDIEQDGGTVVAIVCGHLCQTRFDAATRAFESMNGVVSIDSVAETQIELTDYQYFPLDV